MRFVCYGMVSDKLDLELVESWSIIILLLTPLQEENCTTRRANLSNECAQDDKQVAQAISDWEPRRDESDLAASSWQLAASCLHRQSDDRAGRATSKWTPCHATMKAIQFGYNHQRFQCTPSQQDLNYGYLWFSAFFETVRKSIIEVGLPKKMRY